MRVSQVFFIVPPRQYRSFLLAGVLVKIEQQKMRQKPEDKPEPRFQRLLESWRHSEGRLRWAALTVTQIVLTDGAVN